MKTYINHIKGKDYLYAYDRLFIAKGKTIQKNKSLGPVDSLSDMAPKKQKFIQELIKEEAEQREKYWKTRIFNSDFLKYVSIQKIEKARTELYRAKEQMGSMGTSAMETAFLVDFIYNSNKIEGSKVPRESIEKRVKAGTGSKNDEVGNTMKAIYDVNQWFKFTPRHLTALHKILLGHEPSQWGIRKERVVVGNSEVAQWETIKKQLKELFDWYQVAKKSWYPPELAFTFYLRFERIHPFKDGNGRIGRLIMNKILKDHRYHPIIIWNKRRQAHMKVFAEAAEGRKESYFKFMADEFIKTHEIYLSKIQKAFDLEKQMQYFLEPSEYAMG